jgi:hypothetical protein
VTGIDVLARSGGHCPSRKEGVPWVEGTSGAAELVPFRGGAGEAALKGCAGLLAQSETGWFPRRPLPHGRPRGANSSTSRTPIGDRRYPSPERAGVNPRWRAVATVGVGTGYGHATPGLG